MSHNRKRLFRNDITYSLTKTTRRLGGIDILGKDEDLYYIRCPCQARRILFGKQRETVCPECKDTVILPNDSCHCPRCKIDLYQTNCDVEFDENNGPDDEGEILTLHLNQPLHTPGPWVHEFPASVYGDCVFTVRNGEPGLCDVATCEGANEPRHYLSKRAADINKAISARIYKGQIQCIRKPEKQNGE